MRRFLNWFSFSVSHRITALPSEKKEKIFLDMLVWFPELGFFWFWRNYYEGRGIYFSYIRDIRTWDTHLSLIQTIYNLNIQGSEGKPFCSPSCNQTAIAMAAWYNGLEPFTFGDAYKYMNIFKTGGKGDFQLWLITSMEHRIKEAGKEGTFTHLCTITFPVLLFS